MKIINISQNREWNKLIKSFADWDIYYLNEYVQSLAIHGDGEPLLIYFESEHAKMAYIMMQNDIAEMESFRNKLPHGKLYDWTTPYGYGGPLYDGVITSEWLKKCMGELCEYAKQKHIVSQFFRFHPLLQNQILVEEEMKVLYTKKTVYIDTASMDEIMKNMTPNNRNMVRKAEKNGINIFWDKGERLHEFEWIYKKTMELHQADAYYNFEDNYFQYIIEHMKKNIIFFYATYENKIISSSIFFYNNNYMHYHLSGTLPEYRSMAAANLLLTQAAYWACEHGIKKLHLGGGVGVDDSLLRFKKHFNRKGCIDFCIGANIFDQQKFNKLVKIRKEIDADFDVNKKYMILYRA